MPRPTTRPPAAISSSNEQSPLPAEQAESLTFSEHVEALRKGVALSLGNHRRAQILIEDAVRLEKQAGQQRTHMAAIQAAGGPRCQMRVGPLARAVQRLDKQIKGLLQEAEACLGAGTQNPVSNE